MFQNLVDALQYSLVQRALIAGVFIAICCSCLGVFLVLRRLSLIGDGIAHVCLGTIGIGILLGFAPLLISVPLVMLASLGIMWLSERTNMYGDAAIGLVAAMGIALGVLLADLGGGFNVELFSYLFGSILAVEQREVWLSVGLSFGVIAVIVLFYHELFAITFDPEFAPVLGIRVGRIDKLLVMCTAVTVVLGIKVVGTMLVSSLIIFPAVTALQVARSFLSVLIVAVGVAVTSIVVGIFLAVLLNLPTGAIIVCVNFVCFVIAYLIGHFGGR